MGSPWGTIGSSCGLWWRSLYTWPWAQIKYLSNESLDRLCEILLWRKLAGCVGSCLYSRGAARGSLLSCVFCSLECTQRDVPQCQRCQTAFLFDACAVWSTLVTWEERAAVCAEPQGFILRKISPTSLRFYTFNVGNPPEKVLGELSFAASLAWRWKLRVWNAQTR